MEMKGGDEGGEPDGDISFILSLGKLRANSTQTLHSGPRVIGTPGVAAASSAAARVPFAC